MYMLLARLDTKNRLIPGLKEVKCFDNINSDHSPLFSDIVDSCIDMFQGRKFCTVIC